MDSFEWNKIFGAVLGTGLLVFGLKIVGGTLFHGEEPAKPGYVIAVAEPAADGKPAEAKPVVPLGVLLAKADKDLGMAKAKACAACHDFTKGGPNKVGPNLWGVVGRPMGAAAGFTYSDGFKAMGSKAWGYEELNMWLTSPKEYIKGTNMSFGGIHNDEARANMMAYLASLSDTPVAFPKP
jgi:cytochrome c